ncbi:MAG: radical SAM protein [Hyphomicrobium sp.]|nr:radical SAM protein [Hyphomicrobium sp.]
MVARTEAIDVRATRAKFEDPDWTALGERRARVSLRRLETLWINTGTLCNITCRNCYIESSPTNDRLAYIELAEVIAFLDEAKALGTREIGFTGGEPFLNPEFCAMLEAALARGFEVLVLTNAMVPMQRPGIKARLLALRDRHTDRLRIRVSLDHFTAALHEVERGAETFAKTVAGLNWLNDHAFKIAIAGRTCWNEPDDVSRDGYRNLIAAHGWHIDADDRAALMLLPEMDAAYDGPEITTKCWDILRLDPNAMMCASSRMVVKRRGAAKATVLPCTLLPYEPDFEMGATLEAAAHADGGMFDAGAVKLCHKNCAKFCVLGGGSCS